MSEFPKPLTQRQVGTLQQLLAAERRLRRALKPFATIKADNGDDFSEYPPETVIRCEISAGEIHAAREALEAPTRITAEEA